MKNTAFLIAIAISVSIVFSYRLSSLGLQIDIFVSDQKISIKHQQRIVFCCVNSCCVLCAVPSGDTLLAIKPGFGRAVGNRQPALLNVCAVPTSAMMEWGHINC
jgi:hypothetical protein